MKRLICDTLAVYEHRLLVSGTIDILNWVIDSEGKAEIIGEMPASYKISVWAIGKRLYIEKEITSNYLYNFYVSPQGIRFLIEHGVHIPRVVEVKSKRTPPKYVEGMMAFVQTSDGKIAEVSLPNVPGFAVILLQRGSLAMYEGKLYGLSPEHILDN